MLRPLTREDELKQEAEDLERDLNLNYELALSEDIFVDAFKFIQSGYLSEDAISALASNIRNSWSNNNYWPSAHEVKLAALLAARGTDLVSVEHMSLVDIDITSIKDDNITSLASVVSEQVDLRVAPKSDFDRIPKTEDLRS